MEKYMAALFLLIYCLFIYYKEICYMKRQLMYYLFNVVIAI